MICLYPPLCLSAAVLLAVVAFTDQPQVVLARQAVQHGRFVGLWKLSCWVRPARAWVLVLLGLLALITVSYFWAEWLSTPVGQIIGQGVVLALLVNALWDTKQRTFAEWRQCLVASLDRALPAAGERRERFNLNKGRLASDDPVAFQAALARVLAAAPPEEIHYGASSGTDSP